MSRFFVFFAVLGVPLCIPPADACPVHRGAVVVARTPYVAPVVATPYVATVAVQAVPVYVPNYQASYLSSSTSELIAQIRQEVRAELKDSLALENRLRALERGSAAPLPPSPAPSSPAPPTMPPVSAAPKALRGLLATHCSSCHSTERAKGAGTRFAFFSGGKQRPLSDDELGEALERVLMPQSEPGSMPKGHPLAAEERVAVALELIRSQPQVGPPQGK